jgi:negative regulator of flagellin synthesis FlgM
MSNRIDQMTHGLLGKIAENSSGTAKKAGNAGAAAPGAVAKAALDGTTRSQSAGETVELTSSAKLLERLEKTLASLPEIDRARVDAVKTAIENGDYEIDSDSIAAALLRADGQPG